MSLSAQEEAAIVSFQERERRLSLELLARLTACYRLAEVGCEARFQALDRLAARLSSDLLKFNSAADLLARASQPRMSIVLIGALDRCSPADFKLIFDADLSIYHDRRKEIGENLRKQLIRLGGD